MNLQAMFPTGRWDATKTKLLVRKGRYDWPAAVMKEGRVEITDFGRRVALPVPEVDHTLRPKPGKKARHDNQG